MLFRRKLELDVVRLYPSARCSGTGNNSQSAYQARRNCMKSLFRQRSHCTAYLRVQQPACTPKRHPTTNRHASTASSTISEPTSQRLPPPAAHDADISPTASSNRKSRKTKRVSAVPAPLPPVKQWSAAFTKLKPPGRYLLASTEAAKRILEGFGISASEDSSTRSGPLLPTKPKTIIEIFPGTL